MIENPANSELKSETKRNSVLISAEQEAERYIDKAEDINGMMESGYAILHNNTRASFAQQGRTVIKSLTLF